MNITQNLSKATKIIKLDRFAINEVSRDPSATPYSFAIPLIAGVANAIGLLIIIPGIFILPVVLITELLIITAIIHSAARIFGGQSKFIELFRPLGHASILIWITAVPLIGPMFTIFIALWYAIMQVFIVREVFAFNTKKSIAIVIIPQLITGIILFLLGVAFWQNIEPFIFS